MLKSKPCATCRHYVKDIYGGEDFSRCGKVVEKYDRISGKYIYKPFFRYTFCEILRTFRLPFLPISWGNTCGIRGKYWEAKRN